MPYKPTGRPVGRPKTKDYKTISLKMPQDLLDRVQTYAREHRQSVSELIRDGLEWRITEGDPRGQHMSVKSYSSNTILEEMAQSVHLVEEGIPFDEDVAAVPVPRPHDGNTVFPEEIQSQHETPPAQPHDDNTVLPTHIPPRRRGRHSGEIRQRILTLLSAHGEGLNAEELRVFLKPEKPLGDTLQGMRKAGVVKTRGRGKDTRYFVA